MIAAIACTGDHVADLIAEVERLGIGEDTIVVVMSDHLAMRNTLADALHQRREQRRNYVTVLGADKTGRNIREGAMIDIYPTLLELLGYEIKDGQAGLGVSLLSPGKTLTEQYQRERVSRAFRYNVNLKRELWRDPDLPAMSAEVAPSRD